MYRTSCSPAIFFQPIKIDQRVLFCEKTGLAIIATLNDMEWDSGNYDSRTSWHRGDIKAISRKTPAENVVCPLLLLLST
jgi:hypothetical protein